MLQILVSFVLPLGVSLAAVPIRPDAYACDGALSNHDASRLRRELQRLLPTGEGPLRAEKKRLTKVLLGRVNTQVATLDLARREEFLHVVERAFVGSLIGLPRADPEMIKTAEGVLTTQPGVGLMLAMDDYRGTSLMNWITLDHELSHLSRHVSGAASVADSLRHVEGLRSRRLGIYREEIGAFRESYRFIREAYPADRYAQLERVIAALKPIDTSPLVAAGILTFSSDPDIGMKVDEVRLHAAGPPALALLKRYVEWQSELQFLEEVRIAREQDEPAYVREVVGVPKYRRQQRRAEALRPLKRLRDRLEAYVRRSQERLRDVAQP